MVGEQQQQRLPAESAQQPLPAPSLGHSLHSFLASRWAGTDRISLALVVLVHGALVLRGGLLPLEEALFAGTAVAHAAALAFSLLVPPRRWRAVRLPVLAALRAADCVAINAIAEAVRVIEREHREADAAGIVGSFEELLRAVLLLVVSVCALQSLVAGGIGFVLPPLLHLALQAAAVGAVAWRTPSACRAFVDGHSHQRLIQWVYTACRHASATVLLGSSQAFALAAEESSPAEKCRAVAWTLQASIGFLLPTLLVLRGQLDLAQQWMAERQREGDSTAVAAARRSPYMRLNGPALEAAAVYGWTAAIVLCAGAVFVVAALSRGGSALSAALERMR